MTAHAAIVRAIEIVREAQRANSIEHPVELLAFHWNHGAESVARESIDRLERLADELRRSETDWGSNRESGSVYRQHK